MTKEEVLEAIKQMSVIDLADLVKSPGVRVRDHGSGPRRRGRCSRGSRAGRRSLGSGPG